MTVNHNNAPINIANNTIFEIWYVARSFGDRYGFRKLSLKMVYPTINFAPEFVSIPSNFLLSVNEDELTSNPSDAIKKFHFPSISDLELNNITIGMIGNYPLCKCVKLNIIQG